MARPATTGTAAALIPPKPTISRLREIARDCKACDLWERGTQTVFGAGSTRSRVVFVGEQPGNDEDLAGKPFVGPAGKLLDKALERAGIDRGQVYVTNVVKHFKWEAKGKRRIHAKPNSGQVRACYPWLEAELTLVKPDVIVALGATAAQALLGSSFKVTQHRGEAIASRFGMPIVATVHPSSILRAPDEDTRHTEMDRFVDDLTKVARVLRVRTGITLLRRTHGSSDPCQRTMNGDDRATERRDVSFTPTRQLAHGRRALSRATPRASRRGLSGQREEEMRMHVIVAIVVVVLTLGAVADASAQEVRELLGSWVIDGYTFQPGDRSPRGTIAYDPDANAFRGTYVGLKLPKDRPELHGWLYNTQTKKAQYLGKVPFKGGTVGKAKGEFTMALPGDLKGGKFQSFELVAFSAEAKGAAPKEPSGSKIQTSLKPAFYLYAPLPGASVPSVYCGHGQDFSYTSNQDHTCFD